MQGQLWKSLEKQATETLECCEQCLLWDTGGSSKDQNANKNANSKGDAHEILVKNEDSTRNWTRRHICFILAKNLSVLSTS